MLLIVAYDIGNRKRRDRLRRALLAYGSPEQESVFACEATPEQVREIKRRVRALIDPRRDAVGYYPLCAHCARHAEDGEGRRRLNLPSDVVV